MTNETLPPGYRQLVPLDRHRHAGLGPDPQARRRFLAELQSVWLAVPEFVQAARHFPVVFARDARGAPVPQAILGLQAGHNPFAAGGEWLRDVYQPAYCRRWPLHTATLDGRRDEAVICVDESGLREDDASAYFDRTGRETEAWHAMEKLIRDMQAAQAQTIPFCRTLERLELLETFQAHARRRDLQLRALGGLWRVSETRLHALPAKELKKLAERGYLARIYAHLMSLDNFARLLDRIPAEAQQT